MSILASDIISGAFTLLGRPSQGDLPYIDMLDHARDVVRGKMLDLKLAARGHTVIVGDWASPSGTEMTSAPFVGGLTNIIPVKVEWRPANTEGYAYTANVVAFEQLSELGRKSTAYETFVAFYNGFQNIAFSEIDTELINREYRVSYENMSDVNFTALTSRAELPELFITLCKYELALVCLNQVRNDSDSWANERERLRSDFVAQVTIWSDRFTKWKNNQYGNKTFRKQGFRPRYR